MAEFSYLFSLFISLIITSLPFLLVGIFLSSFLCVFIDDGWLSAKLPHNRLLGAILGSSLGLIIPVSQYGHIPFTRRLLLKGVSLPIAISFLVAAPTLNPWVIGLTWSLFPHQPSLLFLRVIIAWLGGLLIGIIFSFYPQLSPLSSLPPYASPLLKTGSFLKPSDSPQPIPYEEGLVYQSVVTPSMMSSSSRKIQLWWENSWREFIELGSLLVYGCAIAALVQFYFNPEAWVNVQQSSDIQLLRVFGLSFGLSTGSLMGTAVIRNFSHQLLSGSLLGFLLFSSLIDLKGIILMIGTLRLKPILIILLLISQVFFLITLLLNFLISDLL
ncbi:MAG: permease [Microcystaceae cyanobacterium]